MDEKHIKDSFDRHERRLNDHGNRIDELEKYQASATVEMRNLIEQIKSLISTMKWAMGLAIGTLLSFFIWYIQNLR